MIGIIGAMEVEVQKLILDMDHPVVTHISGVDYCKGEIDGVPVVVAKCGIGKVAAALTAQTMILTYAPMLLINTGVGGTLTGRLSVGDVAISARAVEHDMDTSPLGDPVGLISGINRIYFDADKEASAAFLSAALSMGLSAAVGTICSGDQFVHSEDQKKRITSHFEDAIACEMEGGAIAHTAYLSDTPFVIVRAISDSADGSSHMDYPTFLGMAAENSYKMIRAFLSQRKASVSGHSHTNS